MPNAETTEVPYKEASARLDSLRAQLDSINGELGAATERMEIHECDAALAGVEPDPTLRETVLALRAKRDNMGQRIATLQRRVEAIRVQEETREKAAKREAAENRLKELRQQYQTAAAAAIAAVLAVRDRFTDLHRCRREIEAMLATEFKGEHRPILPSLPARVTLASEESFSEWSIDACALGYAGMIPESELGRQRFDRKQAFLRGDRADHD
jgi:DNA repair exonuclease SbcCD ATPase subunit